MEVCGARHCTRINVKKYSCIIFSSARLLLFLQKYCTVKIIILWTIITILKTFYNLFFCHLLPFVVFNLYGFTIFLCLTQKKIFWRMQLVLKRAAKSLFWERKKNQKKSIYVKYVFFLQCERLCCTFDQLNAFLLNDAMNAISIEL